MPGVLICVIGKMPQQKVVRGKGRETAQLKLITTPLLTRTHEKSNRSVVNLHIRRRQDSCEQLDKKSVAVS